MARKKRTEYFREYMRKRRAEWRSEGKCIMCGKNVSNSKPGRATCDRCSERAAEWGRRKREGIA